MMIAPKIINLYATYLMWLFLTIHAVFFMLMVQYKYTKLYRIRGVAINASTTFFL